MNPGLDLTTLATIQPDGSVCCQTCGSWTTLDDLMRDGQCPLCREADPKPKGILSIHDDGGKTCDRYTVVLERWGWGLADTRAYPCFTLSSHPGHPQGVSQFGTCRLGRHLGKRISWDELPTEVRGHVRRRMNQSGR